MNILFTGCSSGFGKYVRECLIDQGHSVFGVGLDGPDLMIDFLSMKNDLYGLEMFANKTIDSASKYFSDYSIGFRIDALINNAGITRMVWTPNHTVFDFNDVMFVNLMVPFALSQAFVKHVREFMKKGENNADYFHRIINTSSMGTKMALRTSPGYCASKTGLEAMSRTLAKEFAGRLPISVTCIAPGGVDDTEMVRKVIENLQTTRGMTEEEAEKYNRQSPLGRNMTHEEVWQMFNFMVNDAPLYLSGTTLYATGGMGI